MKVERTGTDRVSSGDSTAPPVGRSLDPGTAMHTDLVCLARHPIATRAEERGEVLRNAHLDRPHRRFICRGGGVYFPTDRLIRADSPGDLPDTPDGVVLAWCPECKVATEYRRSKRAA